MKNIKICIIGLGYVGLPLAIQFSKKYPVTGFDINSDRINELKEYKDKTNEIESSQLKKHLKSEDSVEKGLFCTSKYRNIENCNYYIITVPTPIDSDNNPNIKPLIEASKSLSKILKKNDIVIYESTVYPGLTEEECVPILEKFNNLKYNTDFFVGYSPERINPGDKLHTVDKIKKVTSGSSPESAVKVDNLYKSIISAGTYMAPSIKVAEAAKVIENSQRDVNIAFVNELAKIFNLLDIDTNEVLKAAQTKWNFLPFKPGLVGGHCIGVDPYYLALKAKRYGYNPEIILSGRRVNDSMGSYIADEVIKMLADKNVKIKKSSILILGLTFKENCPDIRNTKVIDIINRLKKFDIIVSVYDPHVRKEDLLRLDIDLLTSVPKSTYDGIILAVAHDQFKNLNIENLKKSNSIVYDVKGFLPNCDKCL